MGRPRKPDSVKKLQGTLAKSRINKNQPQPKLVIPAVGLKLSPEAAKHRQSLSKQLHKLGVLAETDGNILDRYCYMCDLHNKIVEDIETKGLTVIEHGVSKKNPLLSTHIQLLQQLRVYEVELGLTPIARTRVDVVKKPDRKENPFAALMRLK